MNKESNINPFANISPMVEGERVGNIKDMAEVNLMLQDDLAALKIIYPGMRQRELLNSFRDLRTRLVQKSKGENFVLMVTSVNLGGGSSFVAMNTAVSFALDEQKTAIYIDCNYENSFANKILNDSADYGLMDYLVNPELEIKDIIYATGIPRVRIIPPGTGGETSVEKMASGKMAELVKSLKSRYSDRFIIIDVPPVSESSLARILSHVADFAVIVVPFGKVTPNQVLSGIDAVGEGKFSGLVFNND